MPASASKSNSKNTNSINKLTAVLGKPNLLPNEDLVAYEQLAAQFRDAVQPADIIEEILVRDAIDLTWEIHRLKDFKRQLLQSEREASLEKILNNLLGHDGYKKEILENWKTGEKEAVKVVNRFLREKDLDPSAIDAVSFRSQLDDMERFDRLIMQQEARRVAHLREVDRHRLALGTILRDTVASIDDGKTIEHEPKK